MYLNYEYGANRLGGNSLLETIVFGKIVGRAAATTATTIAATTTATDTTSIITRFPHDSSKLKDDLLQSQSSSKNDGNEMKVVEKILHEVYSVKNATEVQQEIRQLMRENAGIVKERNRLLTALNRSMELKRKFYSNKYAGRFRIDENLIRTFEVKSMLIICKTIVRSALMREESRGAHFRSDFPEIDNKEWKMNICCRKKEGDIKLFRRKIQEAKEVEWSYLAIQKEKPLHHLLE